MEGNIQLANSASAHFVCISCGQGDCHLLRLGDQWIGIDCYLPKSGSEIDWERYARIVKKLGIERLDAFIITHFDIDHFRGAARVIEWFIEEKSGIGAIYVTGSFTLKAAIEARKKQIKMKDIRTEYDRLLDAIIKYCPPCDKRTKLRPQTADDPPLQFLKSPDENWVLVSIFPFRVDEASGLREASTATTLSKLDRIDQNRFSSAMMVCSKQLDSPLLLLCGDVPGDPAWQTAIQFWQRDLVEYHGPEWEWLPTSVGPVWTKVPHHGSWIQGHSPSIFFGKAPNVNRHAFVSSANRGSLPDRRTLEAYLKRCYSVWNTASASRHTGEPWALEILSAMRAHSLPLAGERRIEVSWPSNSPMPCDSRIVESDLEGYSEAVTNCRSSHGKS